MRSELYLLRHAKSSWDDPGLADIDRPLAKRGRKAGKLIAAHMRRARIAPDALVCSPAMRTEQTLELIRPSLPGRTAVWRDGRIYGASWEELIGIVGELPEDMTSAMLIGHNPGIGTLAGIVADEGEDLDRVRRKYPTGALATLSFEGGWQQLRPGVARLEAFVRPKQLRG